jgi:hypothetical protein
VPKLPTNIVGGETLSNSAGVVFVMLMQNTTAEDAIYPNMCRTGAAVGLKHVPIAEPKVELAIFG